MSVELRAAISDSSSRLWGSSVYSLYYREKKKERVSWGIFTEAQQFYQPTWAGFNMLLWITYIAVNFILLSPKMENALHIMTQEHKICKSVYWNNVEKVVARALAYLCQPDGRDWHSVADENKHQLHTVTPSFIFHAFWQILSVRVLLLCFTNARMADKSGLADDKGGESSWVMLSKQQLKASS